MTTAPLDQTSVVNSREITLVASSREVTLEVNSRETTLIDNKLERNMAHLDQTTGDSRREETSVAREAALDSRVILLVDNKLERNMAPLEQTQVDSSQAATLVVSSKEAILVDSNREATVSPSLAPRELTDSQLRECSRVRTMVLGQEPLISDHRISQLHSILS